MKAKKTEKSFGRSRSVLHLQWFGFLHRHGDKPRPSLGIRGFNKPLEQAIEICLKRKP